MNPQLIEKVIKSQNEICPEFTYTNPLLDHNVTKALSRTFIKILTSDQNTTVSKNLRLSILENIRKLCTVEPEEHVRFNEEHAELLTNFYKEHVFNSRGGRKEGNTTDKELNAFLIRNFKELNIDSSHNIQVNPEVAQALINLNNDEATASFTNDLIHWNTNNKQAKTLLNNLWNQNPNSVNINDIVIKSKPEIEELLLNLCLKRLESEINLESELSKDEYQRLLKTCAIASYCFQICISILNLMFIGTNFDLKIQEIITMFINNVRINCPEVSFSSLYPTHLCHVAMLLDINLNELFSPIKEQYMETALKYLRGVQAQSEGDYILLMSHFPQWFSLM